MRERVSKKRILNFMLGVFFLSAFLFVFVDMVGHWFLGPEYKVGVKLYLLLSALLVVFNAVFLMEARYTPKNERRTIFLYGYLVFLTILILVGLFRPSHDLKGYKVALYLLPLVDYALVFYGRRLLKGYLRLVLRLTHTNLFHWKPLVAVLLTLLLAVALVIAGYQYRGVLHGEPTERELELRIEEELEEQAEEEYNKNFKNRREPKRDYRRIFNDMNDVQLGAAQRWGMTTLRTREEIETSPKGLVRVETCKRYVVDPLTHSVPYLVPRAEELLENIGKAFQDSLYRRGYHRYHRFIITSVMRTATDVKKLRRSGNVNASENSCHCYGTTVDITYVRFDKPTRGVRANDEKLRQVLMQVLYDQRNAGACYVKYEVKQRCLHVTVR